MRNLENITSDSLATIMWLYSSTSWVTHACTIWKKEHRVIIEPPL